MTARDIAEKRRSIKERDLTHVGVDIEREMRKKSHLISHKIAAMLDVLHFILSCLNLSKNKIKIRESEIRRQCRYFCKICEKFCVMMDFIFIASAGSKFLLCISACEDEKFSLTKNKIKKNKTFSFCLLKIDSHLRRL